MIDLTTAELDHMYEASKCDHNSVVGSEVRQMIGMIRRRDGRIEALEAALREAERFVSYLANETDGCFAGSGTPATCLVMIRAALAPEQDK
jgi:hypothetical protein